MNRFVIVDELPYLYADGKTFKVRWNEEGFTVGEEVEIAEIPAVTYSEISVKAKCAILDSIGQQEEQAEEPETATEKEEKPKTRGRKKTAEK